MKTKSKTQNIKRAILLLAVLAAPFQSQAQDTGRTLLNDFLQDWLGPLLVFFLLAGFVVGVVRNYDLITNKQDDGSMIQGFKNVGVIMLYVLFIGAIITAIIVGGNALIDQLRIN